MLGNLHHKALAASLTLILTGLTPLAQAANAQPSDMGISTNSQPTQVTLVLKLRNQQALERYIRDTVTPGSEHFRQFLSTRQFAEQYGATDAELAQVQAFLKRQGLSSTVMPNHMAVVASGTLAQFGKAFQTSIHSYVMPGTGMRFHRPASPVVMPPAIANLVVATTGLSSERRYLSHRIQAPDFGGKSSPTLTLKPVAVNRLAASMATAAPAAKSGNPTATGIPGSYTVGDVANFYNINPLYKDGITGKGSTVAIVTLSNFHPADAEDYWNGIGLITAPHRITQVHVDGGGLIDGGSGETALDVEQSGGLAPDAKIIVYDAPNAGNGFVDAFMQAVSDNKADSISTSWGSPEMFSFAALNVTGASVTDTSDVGDLKAFHQIFLEAAVQGQSVFAASGDSGAYDTARSLGSGTAPGSFNAPLSVDSPASDPYITAAGGTTRPFSYSFGKGPTDAIKRESVWGWDYLQNYFDTNFGPGKINLFSVGGGGGVSVYWHQPFYQRFTRGIRRSEKGQTLSYNDPKAGPTTLLQLPANFRGRNVPDISLNADPETGYVVVSSTDGGLISEGGTSFVAPQLNGISALLTQSSGHRIGLWNPQVYALQNIFGYDEWTAFHDIRDGDNWFYHGRPGYEPGAGIGTLNVANFSEFLNSEFDGGFEDGFQGNRQDGSDH